MTDESPNRTMHAQQAFEFTDVFSYKFGPLFIGKAKPRRLRLKDLDGPSTAGGRLARQSLLLIPDQGDSGSIVCGWIDVPQHVAELRTWPRLNQDHEARYGRAIDLERDEYQRVLEDLESFLRIQKFEYKLVEAGAAAPKPPPSVSVNEPLDPNNTIVGMVAMLMLGVVIGLSIGYFVFR